MNLPFEIGGKEKKADQQSAQKVTHNDLEEGQVASVGDGRGADESERTRFRGHDGEGNRPPRDSLAGQEIVIDIFLPPPDQGPQTGACDEVEGKDSVIKSREFHPSNSRWILGSAPKESS